MTQLVSWQYTSAVLLAMGLLAGCRLPSKGYTFLKGSFPTLPVAQSIEWKTRERARKRAWEPGTPMCSSSATWCTRWRGMRMISVNSPAPPPRLARPWMAIPCGSSRFAPPMRGCRTKDNRRRETDRDSSSALHGSSRNRFRPGSPQMLAGRGGSSCAHVRWEFPLLPVRFFPDARRLVGLAYGPFS